MKPKKKILNSNNRPRRLFPRGTDGKLLPMKVPLLGSIEQEIIMKPLTLGEIDEFNYERELEGDSSDELNRILGRCLIKPELSFDELKSGKVDISTRILKTLLHECGFDISKIGRKPAGLEAKKSEKRRLYELVKRDNDSALRSAALHNLGYTFFDIPSLTLAEVDLLLRQNNKLNSYGSKGKKTAFNKRRNS